MQLQPTTGNRQVQAGLVFGRRAALPIQERPVDLLDIDPAILDDLESVGVLQETARSLFGIGEGPVRGEFHMSSCVGHSREKT